MCTNASKEEYSPISEKYPIPYARVQPRGWLWTVGGRRELWRGVLERENAKKGKKPRERKLGFFFRGERKRVWKWDWRWRWRIKWGRPGWLAA